MASSSSSAKFEKDYEDLRRKVVVSSSQFPSEEGLEEVLKKNEEVISTIKETEREKRLALEKINVQREEIIAKAASLYNKLANKAELVRRQLRMLDNQRLVCQRRMKRYSQRIDSFLASTKKIADQRKLFVQRMKNPGWEVPHHFHLTALDHYSGNTQPSLMDIATMIRGHLRICAAARNVIVSQRSTHELSERLKREIQQEKVCLQQLDAIATGKNRESQELTQVMEVIKKRYGEEIERFRRKSREAATPQAAAAGSPVSRGSVSSGPGGMGMGMGGGGGGGGADRNRYLAIKMRYLSTLDKSASQAASPSGAKDLGPVIMGVPGLDRGGATGPAPLTHSRVRLDMSVDGGGSTSTSSPPLPGSSSAGGSPRTPGSKPGSPAAKALLAAGSALPSLSLGPSASSPSSSSSSSSSPKKPLGLMGRLAQLLDRSGAKKAPSAPAGPSTVLEEWEELLGVVNEMDEATKSQHQAWDDLETVLRQREELQLAIEELKEGWKEKLRSVQEETEAKFLPVMEPLPSSAIVTSDVAPSDQKAPGSTPAAPSSASASSSAAAAAAAATATSAGSPAAALSVSLSGSVDDDTAPQSVPKSSFLAAALLTSSSLHRPTPGRPDMIDKYIA